MIKALCWRLTLSRGADFKLLHDFVQLAWEVTFEHLPGFREDFLIRMILQKLKLIKPSTLLEVESHARLPLKFIRELLIQL